MHWPLLSFCKLNKHSFDTFQVYILLEILEVRLATPKKREDSSEEMNQKESKGFQNLWQNRQDLWQSLDKLIL